MGSPSCRWKVLALRDQVFDRLGALLRRLDDDAALVLVVAPELHRAADLGDDRVILRPARLEQLRHPRQTAGDVARLGAFQRNARQHVAGLHLRARLDRQDRVDREQVAGVAAARQLHDLAVLVLDRPRAGLRSEPRGLARQSMTTRLVMPVDSSAVSDDRDALDDVLVVDACRRPRSGSDAYRDPTRRGAGRA